MPVHEAIEAYVSRGWRVIPIRPGTKRAAIEWKKYQTQRPTETELEEWFPAGGPTPSCAIIAGFSSDLVVVDVDTHHGGEHEPVLQEAPTNLIAKTPSGGYHLFYKRPPLQNVGNRTNVKPGVDVRADGGYVLVAPSSIDGVSYEWIEDGPPGPVAPAWAIGAKQEEEPKNPDAGWFTEAWARGARKGERNDTMVKLAGYFARYIPDPNITMQLLMTWRARCDEPFSLTGQEIRRAVMGIYAKEQERHQTVKPEDSLVSHPGVWTLKDARDMASSEEPAWLVEQWFPERTLGFISGPPGCGKTWLMLDLAVSVATGTPLLGRYRVNRTGAVHIYQLEDARRPLSKRLMNILYNHLGTNVFEDEELEAIPISLMNTRVLRWDVDRDEFALRIRRDKPVLAVIDPLYLTARPEDPYFQNLAADLTFLKDLRDETGTSFVINHHTRKSADEKTFDRVDLLGSQTLNAFMETGIQCRQWDGNGSHSMAAWRHTKDSGSPGYVHVQWAINDNSYSPSAENTTLQDLKNFRPSSPLSVNRIVLEAIANKPRSQNQLEKDIDAPRAAKRDAIDLLMERKIIRRTKQGLALAVPLEQAIEKLDQQEMNLGT